MARERCVSSTSTPQAFRPLQRGIQQNWSQGCQFLHCQCLPVSQGHVSLWPVTSAGLLAVASAVTARGRGCPNAGEGQHPRAATMHIPGLTSVLENPTLGWALASTNPPKSLVSTKTNVHPATWMLLAKLPSGLSPPWRLWPHLWDPGTQAPLPLSVTAAASYSFSCFCLLSSWMRSARLCLSFCWSWRPISPVVQSLRDLHLSPPRVFRPCWKCSLSLSPIEQGM